MLQDEYVNSPSRRNSWYTTQKAALRHIPSYDLSHAMIILISMSLVMGLVV